jgi:hypothetical protein
LNWFSVRPRRASARLIRAVRIASPSFGAGPATIQPSLFTIRLCPMKGCPRSTPVRQAAATNIELECAAAMHRMLLMASWSSGWLGIGTQFVGTQTMSAPCTAHSRHASGNQPS